MSTSAHEAIDPAGRSELATAAVPAGGAGGCGCGGGGGCGGSTPNGTPNGAVNSAPAPVLTDDPRIDVRELPHGRRHPIVLDAIAALPPGGALVLVAPHEPRPLLAEIGVRYPGQFSVEALQPGPEVWQVRLHRATA